MRKAVYLRNNDIYIWNGTLGTSGNVWHVWNVANVPNVPNALERSQRLLRLPNLNFGRRSRQTFLLDLGRNKNVEKTLQPKYRTDPNIKLFQNFHDFFELFSKKKKNRTNCLYIAFMTTKSNS